MAETTRLISRTSLRPIKKKTLERSKTKRSRMLSEHQETILEVWKKLAPKVMKQMVVLVEHTGDHVTVATAAASEVIRKHEYHLGLCLVDAIRSHLVDAIEAQQPPDEPFVVIVDWDGADGGCAEVHQDVLRFRS